MKAAGLPMHQRVIAKSEVDVRAARPQWRSFRNGHLLPSLDQALTDGLEETYRRSRAASVRPEPSGEVVEMPRSEAI